MQTFDCETEGILVWKLLSNPRDLSKPWQCLLCKTSHEEKRRGQHNIGKIHKRKLQHAIDRRKAGLEGSDSDSDLSVGNGPTASPEPFNIGPADEAYTEQLVESALLEIADSLAPHGTEHTHPRLSSVAPPPFPFTHSGFHIEPMDFEIDPTMDEMELEQTAQAGRLIEEMVFGHDQDCETDDEGEGSRSDSSGSDEESSESEDEQPGAPPKQHTRRTPTSYLNRNTDFHPWPDRITCLIDIIMNLPRVNFSQSQADLILFVMRALGAKGVPARIQSALRWSANAQKLYGVEQVRYEGAQGHRYYVNSLSQIIAQEFSNRHVRPSLSFLPEDSYPRLTEPRQASRWLSEYPIELATPWQRHPESRLDYYTCEPAQIEGGEFRVPFRWFTRGTETYAKCWGMDVVNTPDGRAWRVTTSPEYEIPLKQFVKPCPVLVEDMKVHPGHYPHLPPVSRIAYMHHPHERDSLRRYDEWKYTTPAGHNPWRDRAHGHPVVAVPLNLYCDDTSGNKGKKWNKHHSWLFTLTGLPRREASKEYNVHFLTVSNKASPLEMLDGIVDQLNKAQSEGVWAWDSHTNEPILFIPSVFALMGDNPMQSEFASHVGLAGRMFCRICKVSGSKGLQNPALNTATTPPVSPSLLPTHSPSAPLHAGPTPVPPVPPVPVQSPQPIHPVNPGNSLPSLEGDVYIPHHFNVHHGTMHTPHIPGTPFSPRSGPPHIPGTPFSPSHHQAYPRYHPYSVGMPVPLAQVPPGPRPGPVAPIQTVAHTPHDHGSSTTGIEWIEKQLLDFIQVGEPRNAGETRAHLYQNLTWSKRLGNETRIGNVKTQTGVKDTFSLEFIEGMQEAYKKKTGPVERQRVLDECWEALQTERGSYERMINPVWRIRGLDAHQDTPVEVLHVVLLGLVKYFWRDAIKNQLKDDAKGLALVISRLASINIHGLNIGRPPEGNLVSLAGSLIGKDFRIIAQVAPFVLEGLISKASFDAWKSLSRLVPLIYQHEIENIDEHVRRLQDEIREFLLRTAKWTGSWFQKPKFHLLVHLPDHIRRFGPPITFATETFESYNAVIRGASIHSNRGAPSRDIGANFAHWNRIRHWAAGGLIQDLTDDCVKDGYEHFKRPKFSTNRAHWRQAGKVAISISEMHPVPTRMGVPTEDISNIAPFKRAKNAGNRPYQRTMAGEWFPSHAAPDKAVFSCQWLLLANGEKCRPENYVIVKSVTGETTIGRVEEIIAKVGLLFSELDCVLIRQMRIANTHRTYDMPYLASTSSLVLVSRPQDIVCLVNVQHDCSTLSCDDSGVATIMQEHSVSTLTKAVVNHAAPLDQVVLNTASMQDAHHIQRFRAGDTYHSNQNQALRFSAEALWVLRSGRARATAAAQAVRRANARTSSPSSSAQQANRSNRTTSSSSQQAAATSSREVPGSMPLANTLPPVLMFPSPGHQPSNEHRVPTDYRVMALRGQAGFPNPRQ